MGTSSAGTSHSRHRTGARVAGGDIPAANLRAPVDDVSRGFERRDRLPVFRRRFAQHVVDHAFGRVEFGPETGGERAVPPPVEKRAHALLPRDAKNDAFDDGSRRVIRRARASTRDDVVRVRSAGFRGGELRVEERVEEVVSARGETRGEDVAGDVEEDRRRIEATPGRSARAAVRRASRWRARRASTPRRRRARGSRGGSVADARRSNQGARRDRVGDARRGTSSREPRGACRSSPSTNAGAGGRATKTPARREGPRPRRALPQPEGPERQHPRANTILGHPCHRGQVERRVQTSGE